jgi:hypothetical protein
MPFKSKAQQRFMFAAEDRGELPKGTAKEWADATEKKKGGIEALPEKVKMKKSAGEMAKIALTRYQKEYYKDPREFYNNLGSKLRGNSADLFKAVGLADDLKEVGIGPLPSWQEIARRDIRSELQQARKNLKNTSGKWGDPMAEPFTIDGKPNLNRQGMHKRVIQLSDMRNYDELMKFKDKLKIDLEHLNRINAENRAADAAKASSKSSPSAASAETAAPATPKAEPFDFGKDFRAEQAARDAARQTAYAEGVSRDNHAAQNMADEWAKAEGPAAGRAAAQRMGVDYVESAASKASNSKLLRNLGIGAGALGLAGLGGYGLYRALRNDEGAPTKEGSMKKSAAEIAEKVCTPEEKAKCCKGEDEKKDEKKTEDKGNPFGKKDEENPFVKKEAASCSASSSTPKKKKAPWMKKKPAKKIAEEVLARKR